MRARTAFASPELIAAMKANTASLEFISFQEIYHKIGGVETGAQRRLGLYTSRNALIGSAEAARIAGSVDAASAISIMIATHAI